MKDDKYIEELLERYYDGLTTEAEEQTLKEFFTCEEIPAHLQAEKAMFLQLAAEATPKGMEQRLSSLVDEWEKEEQRTIGIRKRSRTIRLQWIAGIAASLLLLFGIGRYLYEPSSKYIAQDTCATPEEAYAETQKALIMFSTALNKGMGQLEAMHRVDHKINETFNELKK
ncbi:MAG: hypothetical protein J6B31_05485 [Bacteroidaceae bacterium]|nr:hypothetical protein [Bacteroidaceae bacterium]